MNGETLQDRIYAGYAKAATKTGRPYSLYRAASPINPIDDGNYLGAVNCLFAAEKRFEVPNKFKIPTRYLYADGSLLQQRDIIIGPYGTYFIGDMQPNLPMQAIKCNDAISIDRPVYVNTNGVPVVVPESVAFALPVFRQLKKVDIKRPEFGANTAGTAIAEYFGFLPIAVGTVQQHDIITDQDGRLYELDTIDNTEIGVVITFRQTQA